MERKQRESEGAEREMGEGRRLAADRAKRQSTTTGGHHHHQSLPFYACSHRSSASFHVSHHPFRCKESRTSPDCGIAMRPS